MKKTIAMLLVLVLVLSLGLSACGNKAAENTNSGVNSNEASANTNEVSANTNNASNNTNSASNNTNNASNNTNNAPAPEPPETVESLINAFMDKIESGTGVTYSTEVAMKITMEVLGQLLTTGMSSDLKTESKGDITHVKGTMESVQDDEKDTDEGEINPEEELAEDIVK